MDTRAFYDRISGAYDLIADASEGACRDQGLEALHVLAGERILELGFGTGHGLVALASRVGPAGWLYGLDISEGMIAVARRRVEATGSRNVILMRGDARALPFREEMFDAAFMSFTLELFESKAIPIVLREVRRVLRPTGRLGVVAMAKTTQANAATQIYKWLHRHFPHFVDCRPIDVVGQLTRAGFRTSSTRTMSIWGLSVVSSLAVKPALR